LTSAIIVSQESQNLSSRQDERFDLPRFHPPSRRDAVAAGGALSVPRYRADPGPVRRSLAGGTRLAADPTRLAADDRVSLAGKRGGRVPVVAIWWAILDSNQ
jgi:hypothetical protein